MEYLNPQERKIIVDCTLGLGGHAKAILGKLGKNGKLIGIDMDEAAIGIAKEALKAFNGRFTPVNDNFTNIKNILKSLNIPMVDGFLFDLGVSSMQIDSGERGFSLRKDGPLDMRMDSSININAADIINSYGQQEIEQILREFGEERLYKRIVNKIIQQREIDKIDTTFKLVSVIKASIPRMNPKKELNIITRIFQALRIAVNSELDNLRRALNDSIEMLAPKGRIVVISYHSLEDRIVKNMFRTESIDCLCPPKQPQCTCSHKKKLVIMTKKPVVPNEKEIYDNPRSRSAKLRAAEKI